MGFAICAAIVIVVLLLFFNTNANRIRKINNIINKDRSVCDFIISLKGWNISPVEVDGLRIVITPMGLPIYHLYLTYNGQRPSNDKIEELYYQLTDTNSAVYKAHQLNIPFEQYADVEVAASLRIIDMRKYRKYKEWYDEHYRLMMQYGIHSKEANDYFNSFQKSIKHPDEWRRYQDYRMKQK